MTDEHTAARRRSSSLAGATLPIKTDAKKKHRRHHSDHIAEEEGDEYSSDADQSDSGSDSSDFELDDMSADGLDDDEETGLNKRDRRRRRRRKRRNTLLDQRVIPDDAYTKEEKKLADQTLLKSMLINGSLICLWYGPSLHSPLISTQLTSLGTSSPYPFPSTTSGCSRKQRATESPRTSSPFRSSPHVCT
jgi:solute carrier family 35 protein C2